MTGVQTCALPISGPSVYTMYFEDPNRNGGVINIPNSINVPFYVESQLIISAFLGFNNSPILLQPPIDDGVVGQPFIHNANAYDPDGDSLSYQLTSCKGAGGASIPGYSIPQASNFFRLDSVTGDLEWDSPVACGEYNIAFLIKEWRHGVQIGFVERDMQVNIVCNNPNNNFLPQVASMNDTCVVAGSLLTFTVSASDSNNGNTIVMTATGGPLEVAVSPAQFTQPVSGTGFVSQQFNWQTDCAHVRLQPYQMVFKAEDNDPFINLIDMKSMRIRVIAPAPQNPAALAIGNSIQLTWNQSVCSQANGYAIYRRVGFYGYVPGLCETGVPVYTGYVRIANVSGLTTTSFVDDNGGVGLAPGTDYCYMVVAQFPDGSQSIASAEACAVLKKETPVLTNVSITSTAASSGTVYVAWSRPSDLDTLQYPGPYEYHILRAASYNGGTYAMAGINSGGLNDTIFNDASLNTSSDAWHYKISLFATVNGALTEAGTSQPAS